MKRSENRWLAHTAILVSVAFAGCAGAPDVDQDPEDLEEVEQDLDRAPRYKVQVKKGTLSITGNNADSKLTVRLGAATNMLEVDVGDDGVADFRFDRSAFDRIVINAGGGKDVVRMDERAGAFTLEEQVTINGGSGDDTLLGGVGPETILGGTGNDSVTRARWTK